MLSLLMVFPHVTGRTLAASNQDPPLTVGIWSNDCLSFIMASNNTSCGNLSAGNTITVQVNVTNAPVGSIDGYDLFLYYDPAVLSATSADQNSTGSSLDQTRVLQGRMVFADIDINLPGRVRLSATCTCYNRSTSGTLAAISFNILVAGVSPISLASGIIPTGQQQSYTELTTPTGFAPATADGYFVNTSGNPGPVASFTFPAKTSQGGTATFDATGSYDPDNSGAPNSGIAHYKWDFGGASALSSSVDSPTYRITLGSVFGNFSVRLTVVDSDNNFEGMQTRLFTISQKPFHDLVAQSVSASPSTANAGDKVTVNAIIRNNGTFTEDFNLNVSYTSPTTRVGTENNQTIDNGASSTFSFTLDTTGLAPGFYTLTATVTVLRSVYNSNGFENITSNNIRTTQLQIAGTSSTGSLLLIAGGAIAGVAALSVLGLLLRRRRQASASR